VDRRVSNGKRFVVPINCLGGRPRQTGAPSSGAIHRTQFEAVMIVYQL